MEKQFFIELLNKYKEEKSSIEENRLLITYYNLFDLQPEELDMLEEERRRQVKQTIKEGIWKRIESKEPGHQKVFFHKQWMGLAAAVVFVTVCCWVLINKGNSSEAKEGIISVLNTQKENTLIHLPDGSTAILNVGSKLNYPSSFDQLARREVFLEGEAFFDISHNPSKPFIVHTGLLETTVLGTAFNVKALPVDSQITVVVTRGKVKISNGEKILGLITKGQEAIYHKRNDQCVQKTVAKDVTLNWKKQDVLLDDVTVEDAAKLLEERYNITISFTDTAIKNNRFTTVLQRGEGVEEVIKSICEFNAVQYSYNKKTKTIIISKNSTPIN